MANGRRGVLSGTTAVVGAAFLALVAAASPVAADTRIIDGAGLSLSVTDVPQTRAMVSAATGTRGAALATLSDGTILLGGGPRGGTVFALSRPDIVPEPIGDVMTARERLDDSRFAITDIAVLSETSDSARLLISYPRLGRGGECVEVTVEQATYDRVRGRLGPSSTWFTSTPCVPIAAVQHASGRIAVVGPDSAYVTVGDLGFPGIVDRSRRGDLGSVHLVTAGRDTRISQGHRNLQGIVLTPDGRLYTSEHGPQGGDELNRIRPGRDYGWPFVSLGQPYSPGDAVPVKAGTHAGYPRPLYAWIPSIAPTELVQVPSTSAWGPWRGQFLMGTLREESLVRIRLDARDRVQGVEVLPLGERIRDLEGLPDGRLVATTDDGDLLLIRPR